MRGGGGGGDRPVTFGAGVVDHALSTELAASPDRLRDAFAEYHTQPGLDALQSLFQGRSPKLSRTVVSGREAREIRGFAVFTMIKRSRTVG